MKSPVKFSAGEVVRGELHLGEVLREVLRGELHLGKVLREVLRGELHLGIFQKLFTSEQGGGGRPKK